MTEAETNAAPMRLRAEAPRVTRLSRKMLASVAAVALVGIGGALIYARQTRGPGDGGEELRIVRRVEHGALEVFDRKPGRIVLRGRGGRWMGKIAHGRDR